MNGTTRKLVLATLALTTVALTLGDATGAAHADPVPTTPASVKVAVTPSPALPGRQHKSTSHGAAPSDAPPLADAVLADAIRQVKASFPLAARSSSPQPLTLSLAQLKATSGPVTGFLFADSNIVSVRPDDLSISTSTEVVLSYTGLTANSAYLLDCTIPSAGMSSTFEIDIEARWNTTSRPPTAGSTHSVTQLQAQHIVYGFMLPSSADTSRDVNVGFWINDPTTYPPPFRLGSCTLHPAS
jgi:hypothetical protein